MKKFLKLSAAALSIVAAVTGAEAAPTGRMLLSLPMANSEATAAAATIASEAPFQKFIVLTCTGTDGSSVCRGKLDAIPVHERLVIQFASCLMTTTEGGEMGIITLAAADAKFTQLFGAHFIAPGFRGGAVSQIHIASQPMLLTVAASQVLHIEAVPNGGSLKVARCGMSGVRQKLG
jgi:hypothetical protein